MTTNNEAPRMAVCNFDTIDGILKQIKSGMFADRDTLEEAFAYIETLAYGMDAAAIYTAVFVMMNTLEKILRKEITPIKSRE